ncbi:MAG TPA: hypothetical protein VFM77_11055 [Terriglobales bacterium]|nr:hypothetical protein [Terriglobales bacterium]
MALRSAGRLRIAKRKKKSVDVPIQPQLVLPKKEDGKPSDEDPLMQQYIKIGESALKGSSLELGDEDPRSMM